MATVGKGVLGGTLGTAPSVQQTDPTGGFAASQLQRSRAMGDQLSQRYQQSLSDPNFALGDPTLQQLQLKEMQDKTAASLGDRNIGGPAAKALLAKSLADWKLGQMQLQASERDKMRQAALNAYSQTGPGLQSHTVAGQPGVLQSAIDIGKGAMGSAAGDWLGKIFGGGGEQGGMSAGNATADNPQFAAQRQGERQDYSGAI